MSPRLSQLRQGCGSPGAVPSFASAPVMEPKRMRYQPNLTHIILVKGKGPYKPYADIRASKEMSVTLDCNLKGRGGWWPLHVARGITGLPLHPTPHTLQARRLGLSGEEWSAEPGPGKSDLSLGLRIKRHILSLCAINIVPFHTSHRVQGCGGRSFRQKSEHSGGPRMSYDIFCPFNRLST